MTTIDQARERVDAKSKAVAEAAQEEHAARAELARLSLLELATENPVTSFSFSVEWEYDDEGSYFPTAEVFGEVEHEKASDEWDETAFEDALMEVGNCLTPEAIQLLGESKTIQELKEVKF